jgi:hypothetical protein
MSTRRSSWLLIAGPVLLLAADPAWKSKPTAAWTEQDARQILADSAWSKTVKAAISPLQTEDERREGGKMGQDHGIGFDGIADDRPRVQAPKSLIDIARPESGAAPASQSVTLQLRWESALPIRVAELKSHSGEPLNFEADGYRMAVYGIPNVHSYGDPKSIGDLLKKQAVLKRDGKKDVRPSSVEVLQRDDGLVVVYVFPLSAEITRNDRRVEFDAQIGRVFIAQSFDLQEMQFEGKLEL